MTFDHIPVLLKETIDGLDVNPNGTYVDCTLGGGSHAAYLLDKLTDRGHLFAFDQDITAINHAKKRFSGEIDQGKLTLIHSNFRNIKTELEKFDVRLIDGVYYDLGVSSPQLDDAERGFSYQHDSPLDMRMDQSQSLTAYEVVNEWRYEDLVRIISRYGEERFAKRIARSIEQNRNKQAIETTTQLSQIIKEAIPAATRRTGGHPAKRTFQAIRIAVNDELSAIEESLEDSLSLLKVEGRAAVISFHSLEDRLVKNMFREKSQVPDLPPNLPVFNLEDHAEYKIITKKAIKASEEEVEKNRRARSAVLRIIERVTFK